MERMRYIVMLPLAPVAPSPAYVARQRRVWVVACVLLIKFLCLNLLSLTHLSYDIL